MTTWIYRALFSGLFAVLLGLAIRITQLSLWSSDYFRAYYARLGLGENIDTTVANWIEGATLGFRPSGSDKEAVTEALLGGAKTLQAAAESYSWLFGWVALAFMGLGLFGSLRSSDAQKFARCLILLAVVCMIVGQVAPIMSMTATMSMPVVGDSVVQSESKSILTSIQMLHSSGKTWVAGLIVLFSLVTPSLKLLLAMVAARAGHGRLRNAALAVVQTIGKWSMADVFVVAILLTIFSLRSSPNAEVQSVSEAEPGLWFFASHCLLSLIAVQIIGRKRKPAADSESAAVQSTASRPAVIAAQFGICLAAMCFALLFLKPSMRAGQDVVVQSGERWVGTVIATNAEGRLRGRWKSDGSMHDGSTDTMVFVTVLGPDESVMQQYDHESEGTFDLPTSLTGTYGIVFDNVGIVRSTARSVQFELVYEPSSFWTWK